MPEKQQQTHQERRAAAVMLASIAGFVDGVGYLVLFHMFTSHMSGNTIASGVQLGLEHWGEALHRGMPLPAFIIGVIAGRFLAEFLCLRGMRAPFAVAFFVEALMLMLFIGCGMSVYRDGGLHPGSEVVFYLLAALPALAMGVQNATVRRVGGQTVRTSYITGALTDIAEGVVDHLYARTAGRACAPQAAPGHLLMLMLLWIGYFGGAVLGALAEQHWQLWCLFFPIGCLFMLAAVDVIHPFSRGGARTDSPAKQ